MKDADVADPDADDDLVDDEDSDSEDQTIALLRSPALRSPPSSPARAVAFPASTFLVSSFADHLRVIPATCVPDSLSLSISTNQNSSVTPHATPYSNSAPQISMPTPPFRTYPARNNLSTIYCVGIPVKFHCTLFLPPLLFLRPPPSTCRSLRSSTSLLCPGPLCSPNVAWLPHIARQLASFRPQLMLPVIKPASSTLVSLSVSSPRRPRRAALFPSMPRGLRGSPRWATQS